jgi:hypothetical protein
LSTLHFQAPGFYLKQGWEVAARIDCEPPGHTRFYIRSCPKRPPTANSEIAGSGGSGPHGWVQGL